MQVFISGRSVLSTVGHDFGQHLKGLYSGFDLLHSAQQEGAVDLHPSVLSAIDELRSSRAFLKKLDSTSVLASLSASIAAQEHGSLPDNTAIVFGSSRGATATWENLLFSHFKGERLPAYASPISTSNSIPSTIAKYLGVNGLHMYVSGACSTGLHALGVAYLLVKAQQASAVIAGGVECSNTRFTRDILKRAKVLSKETLNSYPHRPNDEQRSGMILGSGCAGLVLSSEPKQSYAEIIGYGGASDDGGLAGISKDALGLQIAIKRALKDARIDVGDIDFIVGHGSSTILGDRRESNAISQVFGRDIPPVIYHKWLTGHMLGASAASSVAFASDHLFNQVIPNNPYDTRHPSIKSHRRLQTCLILSMGFGGNAAALVLRRC